MKKLTKKIKAIFIILAIVIIAGIAVVATKGFNIELSMQSNNRVELNIEKDFEIADIKNITNEVFQNNEVIIQKVEVFEDTVSITAKEISEEQKEQLVEKVNEKYSTELVSDNIEIKHTPNMKLTDLIKPYIFAFGLSSILIVLYMMIRYRKLGAIKVLVKTIIGIAISQITLFSIIAITRIPVGRITIPIIIMVYLGTLFVFTNNCENRLTKLKKEEK